jgi:hypothetical protein
LKKTFLPLLISLDIFPPKCMSEYVKHLPGISPSTPSLGKIVLP